MYELGGTALRILSVIFLFLCLSCGQPEAPTDGPNLDPIRVAVRRDVDSFNPYVSGSIEGEIVAMRLFPQLFQERPGEELGAHSAVLESHQWVTATKLDLILKPGLVWSDGAPLVANDVVFSFEAQTDADIAWFSAGSKRNILSVVAINDMEIRVEFDRERATNLMDLNEGFIVPRHVLSKTPFKEWTTHDWSHDLVVFGPYKIGLHRPDRYLRLQNLNSEYPDLIFQIARDKETHFQWLDSNQVDYSWSIDVERLASIRPPLQKITYANHQFAYLVWNSIDPSRLPEDGLQSVAGMVKAKTATPHRLFSEATVRQALEMALNRPAYLQNIWQGQGSIPATPWSVGRLFHRPAINARQFEPSAAIEALAGQGWSDSEGVLSKNDRPFTFSVLCNSGSPSREYVLYAIQKDLANIGIKMEIEFVEAGLYWDRLARRQFDAAFVMFRRENRPDLGELFHSDAGVKDGLNYASWQAGDELIRRVEDATDWEQIDDYLHQLDLIFADSAPVCLLYEAQQIGVVGSRLTHIEPNFLDPLAGVELWR